MGFDAFNQLPGEDKASCTSKEQCGKDDTYDKHKNMHRKNMQPIQHVQTILEHNWQLINPTHAVYGCSWLMDSMLHCCLLHTKQQQLRSAHSQVIIHAARVQSKRSLTADCHPGVQCPVQ